MAIKPLTTSVGNLLSSANVNGFKRYIRFTANEEEDMVTNANINLSKSRTGITADAYIVKDLTTNKTVVSHNADTLVPIASLSKLVTAVVARKLIADNDRITISRQIIDTYGNTAQFRAGETFLASDLLFPLLMVSSNDAAEAFAQSYGRAQFIAAMNNFTQSIGAYRSYFADPSGLSPDNRSTATDLAIILDWIRKNDPTILETTALKSKTVRNHTWVNPSHFLNWSTYYGGKNGYTPEAALTSAAIFIFGAQKAMYAVVTLGSEARDADVVKLLAKIKQ